MKFADSPAVIEPAITYVSQAPAIDGVLDSCLQDLPIRRFTVVEKSASDNPDVTLSYRLAYGAQFLYVYIEAEAEELTYRDRAYQNGDGFTVVLTHPAPGNAPSREFYVLACSAVDRESMEWTRKIFWYYNVDHIFTPTSDDMKVAFLDGNGTITFELLLPWNDVHPYHPWLSDGIGFNLAMAKAIGKKDVNSYRVVDAGIGDENSPREYALLRFEQPQHVGDPQTFVLLDRNNVSEGDTLHARAVTVAAQPTREDLVVFTQTGEKTIIDYSIASYECGPGLTFDDFAVKSSSWPAGGYVAKWQSQVNGSEGESGFSILPPFDAAALNRRLDEACKSLSPGSYTTHEFTIEEIEADLKELYPYETAAPQRIRISRLIDYIEKAEAGSDQFASRREWVRMAYRSKLDNTLQPYVVWIPRDFDPNRKYPLLVFLHGSASTEADIRGWENTIPEGFMALGPRGRGPSNFFCWDNAQTDIAEAIQSVKENFPIDERNIFLAGFSMGGYGVYRTFYETPGTYRAIAVFSGIPKIGFHPEAAEDAKIIDFTQAENIKIFRKVPVFIFHGKRDLNVSYDETERFVDQLERAGASVQFHAEADKGHESPSDETIRAFFDWVDAVRQE
ncbi:MAG TPA: prolyl oligopeptidase family serine peptidase [Patescibacteria group bacterium]|nr:prolyl oligopeptidase family serine peptidase [Patescibacteria group bacterium]